MTDISYIAQHMDIEELLLTLAEECAELNHAALKFRRVLAGKNPSPVGIDAAHDALLEEIGDVRAALAVITMEMLSSEERRIISDGTAAKITRWRNRLEEAERCGK